MPRIGQRIAAAMAEHVGVDRKGYAGALTEARNQRVEALRRDRTATLRAQHLGAGRLLALQPTKRPQLVALDWMDARRPALASPHMQPPGGELDLMPLQIADLRSPQSVPVCKQDNGRVAMTVSAGLATGGH